MILIYACAVEGESGNQYGIYRFNLNTINFHDTFRYISIHNCKTKNKQEFLHYK